MSIMKSIQEILRSKSEFIFGLLVLFSGLFFIYRDVILKGQIIFPSNLQASFFSPWSTSKFKGWEQGIPFKPIGGHDQVRFLYPARTVTNESLLKGKVPLWNPYIFSGSPHLANYQSAVFYPFNVIYFFIPQIYAWSILTILPFILGYIFAYAFNRSIGCSKVGATIGALAFGMCGFLSTWTQENAVVGQTAVWLPLMLYAIEKTIQSHKITFATLIAISIACSVFAGFFQITFYSIVVCLIYAACRIAILKNNKRKALFYCLGGLILGILLSSIQLLPSIEAFFQSVRNSTNIDYLFDIYLLPFEHVYTVFFPDLKGNPSIYTYIGSGFYHEKIIYVGILPLVFIVACIVYQIKNKRTLFFSILAIVSLLLTVKSSFTIWLYSLSLPLISTFVPSRILIVTSFSLTVLSALGASWFFDKKEKKNLRKILPIAGICIILMATPLYFLSPTGSPKFFLDLVFKGNQIIDSETLIGVKSLMIPWIILVSTLFTLIIFKGKTISKYICIVLTVIPLIYFLNRYSVTGFQEFLYPNHEIFTFLQKNSIDNERFLVVGERLIGNLAVDKGLYSPEGVDAVFPNRYAEIAESTKNNGKMAQQVPRIEVSFPELEKDNVVETYKQQVKLVSFLGVKYVLYYNKTQQKQIDVDKKFSPNVFEKVWEKNNWYAFKNKNAVPRVVLVPQYINESDPQKILDVFFSKDFNPLKTVILEESVAFKTKGSLIAEAKIIKYEPEEVIIKTKSNRNAFLVLSDNYYPGWKAYIDGKEVKLYRANYSFRSILVPKGTHNITFIFDPITFKIGVLGSLISIGIIGGILLLEIKKKRKKSTHFTRDQSR